LAVLLAAVLALALGPTPANALPKWIREFVSPTYGPIDMTMGTDGKLILAYVDATIMGEHSGELRFAVRDGSDWTTTTVAPASYCPHLDVIPLSLAYNANANLAAISFFDHCEATAKRSIGSPSALIRWGMYGCGRWRSHPIWKMETGHRHLLAAT